MFNSNISISINRILQDINSTKTATEPSPPKRSGGAVTGTLFAILAIIYGLLFIISMYKQPEMNNNNNINNTTRIESHKLKDVENDISHRRDLNEC
jgi:hypothetical protein